VYDDTGSLGASAVRSSPHGFTKAFNLRAELPPGGPKTPLSKA